LVMSAIFDTSLTMSTLIIWWRVSTESGTAYDSPATTIVRANQRAARLGRRNDIPSKAPLLKDCNYHR
jgi:hypothetical protein